MTCSGALRRDAADVWNADSLQTAELFAALAGAQSEANCLADNRCSAVACPEVRCASDQMNKCRLHVCWLTEICALSLAATIIRGMTAQ